MRFSLGLLLVPMAEDLQWSRTTLSTMATVFMLITAAALPFTGRLVGAFGALRVLASGLLLAGLAIVLTSIVNQPWQAYASYGVLFALGSAATSITPIGVLLVRAYPDRAGLANSAAIAGMGIGQLLVISVLSAWLVELSWRGSFLWMGLVSMACVLPLIYWCHRTLPAATTGSNNQTPRTDQHKADNNGHTSATLWRSQPLWLLLVIYGICGFQDFLIATHIVAIALDENIGMAVAGNMLAFMGLAGLAGVLLAGVMTDRVGPVWPTVLCFVIRCVIFLMIIISREPWVIITVALLYGMTFWMTAPLTVVFSRLLVGATLLGTVSGFITMVHHGLGGLGAIYGAYVYDRTGSYDGGLMMMLVLSVIALVVVFRLPKSFRQPTPRTS